MTATTAQAATTAGVTIATIRTWCRRGAVAATKHAGRWLIDTASLARRTTYNDGLSVETIGEDRTWEHQGMQVAAYLLDLARLDGAPRLAALVREVTAREAAAAAQAEARARAEEDAYLNQTDH